MNPRRPLLDHETLDIYRVALDFLALALRLLESVPRQRRELRSQLERAAMSVTLNIAGARFYAIARGSALECGALLDVAGLMHHAAPELQDEGKRLLGRVVAMLTRMCR